MDQIDRENLARLIAELIKTIKVVSVYPENNPLPIKLRESFCERFSEFISESRELRLSIGSDAISFGNEPIYHDSSGDEKLASIFHNAGITEISFMPKFGYQQADEFLLMMKNFLNKIEGAEDLITLLWKTNIDGFDYQTLEDSMLGEYEGEFIAREAIKEGDLSDSRYIDQSDGGMTVYNEIFLDDPDEEESDAPSESGLPAEEGFVRGKMGWAEDENELKEISKNIARVFDQHYQLQNDDDTTAAAIIEEDAGQDFYKLAAGLVREMVLQETEYGEFVEAVTVCEKFHSEAFGQGRIDCAVETADFVLNFDKGLSPERSRWKERLHTARAAMGAKDSFIQFGKALNADPDFPPEQIEDYLSLFGWEALASVVDLLGELEHKNHRLAVCDYLSKASPRHVDILAKGIFDRRWFVVRNTSMILARIGGQRANSFLEKAAHHEDSRVRREVAIGLAEASSANSIYLLKEFLWDDDREVSRMAIESFLKLDPSFGVEPLITVINDARFAGLDDTIQEKVVVAFSGVGGEKAVEYLVKLIDPWKFMPSSSEEFYRGVAFRALASNPSEAAEKALLKLARCLRKKIRCMAGQALAERRANLSEGQN